MSRQLLILDTTLRDGEQCPGASMSVAEKIEVATVLDELGVDIIEAGFPASSEMDFLAVKEITGLVKHARVGALARCIEKDIQICLDAFNGAAHTQLNLFIATSKIHREAKLHMTQAQVLEQAVAAVRFAKQHCQEVQFAFEDATRTEPHFLCVLIENLMAEGVNAYTIADTVGYSTPEEYGALFKHILRHVPQSNHLILSTHCHNDLGLAVANSLAAIKNGAKQVECTINGIGERAGNASLEEVVMNTKVRKKYYQVKTRIKTQLLLKASRLVSEVTNFPVPPNKAIVGGNAFAHESGIHQDGMLKDSQTYEIMNPQDVGWECSQLVLGRHSGRAAVKSRLETLGYQINREQLTQVMQAFMQLTSSKTRIDDNDLQQMMQQLGV